MSNLSVATISMEKYGLNFSVDIKVGDFASMIYMVGNYVDKKPGMVESLHSSVLEKVLEAEELIQTYPELREEDGFHNGYYMLNCGLLLALDAYLAMKPINPESLMLPKVESYSNPNFEKLFH